VYSSRLLSLHQYIAMVHLCGASSELGGLLTATAELVMTAIIATVTRTQNKALFIPSCLKDVPPRRQQMLLRARAETAGR
jgi:hypothetical protein